MFINMIISSKNKNSLNYFLKNLQHLTKNKSLLLNKSLKISQKQTSNKIFTVLKSPHVNKTAQEHFEFRLFTKTIRVNTFQMLKILIVLKKIQTTIFAELKLSLKLNLDFKIKTFVFSKLLKPQDFEAKILRVFLVKSAQFIFSSFNFYGKQKLFIYNLQKRFSLNSSVGRAKD